MLTQKLCPITFARTETTDHDAKTLYWDTHGCCKYFETNSLIGQFVKFFLLIGQSNASKHL